MEEEEEEGERVAKKAGPVLRRRNGYHPLNRHWEKSSTIPRVVEYVHGMSQKYQKVAVIRKSIRGVCGSLLHPAETC